MLFEFSIEQSGGDGDGIDDNGNTRANTCGTIIVRMYLCAARVVDWICVVKILMEAISNRITFAVCV